MTFHHLPSQVMALFPTSPWHHLGADEVLFDRSAPARCHRCRTESRGDCARASDCGMTKAAYHAFINRMNAFVRSHNRSMIVWEGFDPTGEAGVWNSCWHGRVLGRASSWVVLCH